MSVRLSPLVNALTNTCRVALAARDSGKQMRTLSFACLLCSLLPTKHSLTLLTFLSLPMAGHARARTEEEEGARPLPYYYT